MTSAPRPPRDCAPRPGARGDGASPSDAAGAASADVAGVASDAAGAPVDVGRAAFADAVAFWNSRPRRRLDWREADDGRCIVLRSRFGEGRIGRWLASKLGDSFYRIRLDEVGTFIWRACDGETPLAEIAGRLREAFGERVEPAEERLARFVQSMLRSRMIDV